MESLERATEADGWGAHALCAEAGEEVPDPSCDEAAADDSSTESTTSTTESESEEAPEANNAEKETSMAGRPWIVAPRGRLLHLLRRRREALSGELDTPACNSLGFTVGFHVGGAEVAEQAIEEFRLKGWCDACVKTRADMERTSTIEGGTTPKLLKAAEAASPR